MKLYIEQKFFSLWGKYNVYHADKSIAFVVQGKPSLIRRKMEVFDSKGKVLGHLQTKLIHFFPAYTIWKNNTEVGKVQQQFSFPKRKFKVDFKDWTVDGDIWCWNYQVFDGAHRQIAAINQQIWNLTEHYVIDTANDNDALDVLMLTLAISAIRRDAQTAAYSSSN